MDGPSCGTALEGGTSDAEGGRSDHLKSIGTTLGGSNDDGPDGCQVVIDESGILASRFSRSTSFLVPTEYEV